MSSYLIDLTTALLNGITIMLDTEFMLYCVSVLIFVIVFKLIYKFIMLK